MRSSNILELLNEATNYLRNNPDERLNFTPFFDSNLCGDEPPCPIHSEWDLCDVGWRMVEAWHMFRRVTGSMPCIEETRLRKVVFESLKEDGLSYRPDYEWSKPEAWMWDQGRALLALCTLAEGGDQADWAIERIRGLLRALERIALRDGESLWFPVEGWNGKEWTSPAMGHPPTGLQLEGAVRFYRLTREPWALDLAIRIGKGLLSRRPPLLDEKGELVPRGGGSKLTHTHIHGRLFVFHGLWLLGRESGEEQFIELARKGYDAVRRLSTSYGWVPESLEQFWYGAFAVDEVCGMMDMVKHGLCRAADGEPDWYDVVERMIVNAISSHQLLDYQLFAPMISNRQPPPDSPQRSYRNVLGRCRGGFTGALHAHEVWRNIANNGQLSKYPLISPSGCCSPSGTISYALSLLEAVQEKGDEIEVQMHFPGHCPHARVEEASLTDGYLRVHLQQRFRMLRVRFPDWVDWHGVQVRVNGKNIPFKQRDRYADIQNPLETVEIRYLVPTRNTIEKLPWGEIHVEWKGQVVQNISYALIPRIPLYPLSAF